MNFFVSSLMVFKHLFYTTRNVKDVISLTLNYHHQHIRRLTFKRTVCKLHNKHSNYVNNESIYEYLTIS